MNTAGLLACSFLAISSAAVAQPDTFAIFKSVERGSSWSRSHAGLPGNSRINAFTSLDNLLVAGTDSGIYLSADEGNTWRRAAPNARILSLAPLGSIIYAGTDRSGILLSRDRG